MKYEAIFYHPYLGPRAVEIYTIPGSAWTADMYARPSVRNIRSFYKKLANVYGVEIYTGDIEFRALRRFNADGTITVKP